MAGEWSWQLAAVIGALIGSACTFLARSGQRRRPNRNLERDRQAILRELQEIEGILDPALSRLTEGRRGVAPPPPEPIRMVQIAEEGSRQKAA
jgi:hypothetical protein